MNRKRCPAKVKALTLRIAAAATAAVQSAKVVGCYMPEPLKPNDATEK